MPYSSVVNWDGSLSRPVVGMQGGVGSSPSGVGIANVPVRPPSAFAVAAAPAAVTAARTVIAPPKLPAVPTYDTPLLLSAGLALLIFGRLAVVRGWFRRRRRHLPLRAFEVLPPMLPNGQRLLRVSAQRVRRTT